MAKLNNLEITPAYCSAGNLQAVQRAFQNQEPASVQLQQFFTENSYANLCALLSRVRWKKKVSYDKHFYSCANPPALLSQFLQSGAFLQFLTVCTGKRVRSIQCELQQFGHKNYTLLHDHLQAATGMIFELELTPTWNKNAGGFSAYLRDGQEVSRVTPTANTLTILDAKGLLRFVKYVNHRAVGKRVVIYGRISS